MSKTWTDQGRRRMRDLKMKERARKHASRRVKVSKKGIHVRMPWQ